MAGKAISRNPQLKFVTIRVHSWFKPLSLRVLLAIFSVFSVSSVAIFFCEICVIRV